MNEKEFDIAIIGLGPAGLSAAIYCSRAKLKTLIIGKKEDSQLWKADKIENFFGFPEPVKGAGLLDKGISQAKKFGSEIIEENVLDVKKTNKGFEIKTANSGFFSKALIFASGAAIKGSGIKNEEKFIGKGLSTCVACDGFSVQGKKAIVIGSTNFAANEARELLQYTKEIEIYTNGKEEKISPEFKEKLKENKISLIPAKIEEFVGENFLQSMKLENGNEIPAEHVFLALGNASAVGLALPLGVIPDGKFIKVNEINETNIKGIFAAGACINARMQIGIAVGQGTIAAFSVINFLTK